MLKYLPVEMVRSTEEWANARGLDVRSPHGTVTYKYKTIIECGKTNDSTTAKLLIDAGVELNLQDEVRVLCVKRSLLCLVRKPRKARANTHIVRLI